MNVGRILSFGKIIQSGYNFPFHSVISRRYAFKSDLKIKWVRPEKIPCYKPEKTGDIEGIPNINKKQILLQFRNSKELETASEEVKKLFTLEFAPKKYTNQLFVYETVDKVKRHDFDVASIEVKIAKWTGKIRALQETLERFPRNKRLKVHLKELIDHRKKIMKYLRRWDYKRFEWLLETLGIVYKAPPVAFIKVTRKDSLRKLTDKYCDDLKLKKLDAYRLQLNNEKPAFLEEKIAALQFIRDEQKQCNVEVTVTEDEIVEVRKLLEQLNVKNVNNVE